MSAITKKLQNQKGESLIEALVAILIIAITSSILIMYIQSAANINIDAKDAFSVYAQEMSIAETRAIQGQTTVVLDGSDITVNYSGNIGADELYSYWR